MTTNSSTQRLRDRRAFLKFLAGSPYIAALGGVSAVAFDTERAADVISDPKDALDVMDFEEAAHRKVQPGHWAYMTSGVDDDLTIKANRAGFSMCNCGRGACSMRLKWTCARSCGGRLITARCLRARRAARNRFTPMASWRWRARPRLAARRRHCLRPLRRALKMCARRTGNPCGTNFTRLRPGL
jgi:hypothetical protein